LVNFFVLFVSIVFLGKENILMSRIAVVTDSTAYLPPELIAQYGIRVIPLELIWGDETFLDGVAIDPPTFYERLSCSQDIPTTTQPSAGAFTDFFTDAARDADGIVGVFISSELSGTIASALVARDSLPDLPIEVVDSRSTSMGLGFMVLAAARAAAEGKSLAEVATAAQALIPRMDVVFVVETLKYLHKGGRIGGASHLLGSALCIKPLLHLDDGRIDALARVRTKKKAVERMLEVMAERAGDKPVHAAVIHANAPEEGARLREQVSERFPHVELYQAELSPVIGTHVGPGTVGVAFYADGEGSGVYV
jgi:DegV family protein with EDD domain